MKVNDIPKKDRWTDWYKEGRSFPTELGCPYCGCNDLTEVIYNGVHKIRYRGIDTCEDEDDVISDADKILTFSDWYCNDCMRLITPEAYKEKENMKTKAASKKPAKKPAKKPTSKLTVLTPYIKYYCDDPGLDQMEKHDPSDAGFDIRCKDHTIVVPAHEFAAVSTGLYLEIPRGFVGIVKPRSGHGFKLGIDTGAGVIDAGYRGEVKVLLFNHSDDDVAFNYGDRIAQIVVVPILPEAQGVAKLEYLSNTERGTKGFGASGTK